MTARTDQLDKVVAAAQWIEANNSQVMQDGFTLQNVTVYIRPDGDQDPVNATQATFTWQDDHYTYTVT